MNTANLILDGFLIGCGALTFAFVAYQTCELFALICRPRRR